MKLVLKDHFKEAIGLEHLEEVSTLVFGHLAAFDFVQLDLRGCQPSKSLLYVLIKTLRDTYGDKSLEGCFRIICADLSLNLFLKRLLYGDISGVKLDV